MRWLVKLLLLVGAIAYLGYAFLHVSGEDVGGVCNELRVEVTDSAKAGFITAAEVRRLLDRAHLNPEGRRMKDINGQHIEEQLLRNPFISSAVCYKTGTKVRIAISQRLPVMRIMADNGADYYLDSAGRVMPRLHYAADLAVATGRITPGYAKRYLVRLGRHLQGDPFWNDQIEQLHVDGRGNLQLITRVGDQIIDVGKPVGMQQKLKHLKAFYESVAPEVGWNKYSRISVAYGNQIICTKRQSN